MYFVVINQNGKHVMGCHDVSCIPDISQRKEMAKAGYSFEIDGKKMSENKIKEFLEGNKK